MEFKWPKRSHRDVDLFFDGYEKERQVDPATGRKRTRYVYRGDYSIFSLTEEQWRLFRIRSALRAAGATAAFAVAHMLGPRGTVLPYIGLPALLSIIPLCYLWMGVVVLLGTGGPKLTVREYSFGLERMENVLWILLALWAVAAGGEVVYLLLRSVYTGAELAAAALELLALGLMVLQQRAQKQVLAACIRRAEPAGNGKE